VSGLDESSVGLSERSAEKVGRVYATLSAYEAIVRIRRRPGREVRLHARSKRRGKMSRGPLGIMLVADNPDDVELTTPGLLRQRLAGRFAVAADGAEALELLIGERATRLSLVMLDLKFPKGSGHEVLERIRANPPTGMLSVILPTSSSEGEDMLVSYSSGANSYMPSGSTPTRSRPPWLSSGVTGRYRMRRRTDHPARESTVTSCSYLPAEPSASGRRVARRRGQRRNG